MTTDKTDAIKTSTKVLKLGSVMRIIPIGEGNDTIGMRLEGGDE